MDERTQDKVGGVYRRIEKEGRYLDLSTDYELKQENCKQLFDDLVKVEWK